MDRTISDLTEYILASEDRPQSSERCGRGRRREGPSILQLRQGNARATEATNGLSLLAAAQKATPRPLLGIKGSGRGTRKVEPPLPRLDSRSLPGEH